VRAQREVKARKTKEAIYRDVFTREDSSPKQRVQGQVNVPLRNCSTRGISSSEGSMSTVPLVGRPRLARTYPRAT